MSKMKYLSVAGSFGFLLASMASAHAQSGHDTFGGWYGSIGLLALHSTADFGITDDLVLQEFDLGNEYDVTGNAGFASVGGTVAGGYGKVVGNAYVGGELSYRYAPENGGAVNPYSENGNNGQNPFDFQSFSPKHNFMLAGRAGYFVADNILMYGLLGITATRFDVSFTDTNSTDHDTHMWYVGITPGVGFEMALSKQLNLDARYTYTAYDRKSTSAAEGTSFVLGSAVDTTTLDMKPAVSAASLALNYHFG